MTQHRLDGGGIPPIKVQKITDEISSNSQAVSGNCIFGGVTIQTDGTNNVTISIYAGTDNTGDKLIPSGTVILGSIRLASISVDPSIACTTGIYVEISGSNGKCQVLYDS